MPAPTPKPSSKRTPAARTGARRTASSWLETPPAFSAGQPPRRGPGSACAARPSGSKERPTRRPVSGCAAKKPRMPSKAPGGWVTSSSATSRISPRAQLERGVAAPRRARCEASAHTVTSGRAASRSSAGAMRGIGRRLLHQHQVVEPGRGRPARPGRGRARGRRGSRRRPSGSAGRASAGRTGPHRIVPESGRRAFDGFELAM